MRGPRPSTATGPSPLVIAALLGFLVLLAVLVVGVIMAVGGAGTDRDAVPDGLAEVTIEAIRDDERLTLRVAGDPADDATVSVCPGLLPGPSDAPGMLERIRVSGCVGASPDAAAGAGTWTLAFATLSEAQTVTFDGAERWLVVVVELSAVAGGEGGVTGAWVAGGPLLPTGPLLP